MGFNSRPRHWQPQPCAQLTAAMLASVLVPNGDAENAAGTEWSGGAYTVAMRRAGARAYGQVGVTSIALEYAFDAALLFPTGVFRAGVRHVVDIWRRQVQDHDASTLRLGVSGGDDATAIYAGLPDDDPVDMWEEEAIGADGLNWGRARICWTPSADRTGVRFRFEAGAFAVGDFAIDDLTLGVALA